LFDIITPDTNFSLSQYHELALAAIRDIQKRNRLPILVGGSGLYIWSLLQGWQIPRVPPDTALRTQLSRESEETSPERLYQRLREQDPEAARKIDPRNVRRVIRALEVVQTMGETLSRRPRKQTPPFPSLVIGLTTDRSVLYERIDRRVECMVQNGWVNEVAGLLAGGYQVDLPALSSIGYQEIGLVLAGKLSLEQAVGLIKTRTHRFVRQQYNWFKLKDDRIKWFDIQRNPHDEISQVITTFLEGAVTGKA
jgi:tRNA dimethylallyltransferase